MEFRRSIRNAGLLSALIGLTLGGVAVPAHAAEAPAPSSRPICDAKAGLLQPEQNTSGWAAVGTVTCEWQNNYDIRVYTRLFRDDLQVGVDAEVCGATDICQAVTDRSVHVADATYRAEVAGYWLVGGEIGGEVTDETTWP